MFPSEYSKRKYYLGGLVEFWESRLELGQLAVGNDELNQDGDVSVWTPLQYIARTVRFIKAKQNRVNSTLLDSNDLYDF